MGSVRNGKSGIVAVFRICPALTVGESPGTEAAPEAGEPVAPVDELVRTAGEAAPDGPPGTLRTPRIVLPIWPALPPWVPIMDTSE
jgi:hypothetical protein